MIQLKNNLTAVVLLSPFCLGLLSSCQAQYATSNPTATAVSGVNLTPIAAVTALPSASSQTLAFDFNGGNPWPKASARASLKGAFALIKIEDVGTIDTRNGAPSGAFSLLGDAKGVDVNSPLKLTLASGPLTHKNTQPNLSRLTLSFDLWTSQLRPVRVRVQSLDSKQKVTGSRRGRVYPPISGSFYRFGLDLDQTRVESGRFDPLAPFVQVVFELDDADGSLPRGPISLRVDNLTLSAPTFYVSERGSDKNDGRSEATPFATPQKAASIVKPGDTILLMNGTYTSAPGGSVISLNKSGTPTGWITVRNFPGHKPVLNSDGWGTVSLNQDSAYIEFRGLTLRGNRSKFTIEDGLANASTQRGTDGQSVMVNPALNTNGFTIDARKGTEEKRGHHIRLIGNTVCDHGGGGIAVIGFDYATVENNLVYDNCHTMRYAGSGISIFRGWNFDQTTGTKNFVIGNIAYGNRCYVPWSALNRISDGNGIIVDDMINYQEGASKVPYTGRTLVQNNLAYGNGGSGIHAYASNHVDIVNNTAYHNAQSPELNWRQIFAGGKGVDVNIRNNIWWSQAGKPVNFLYGDHADKVSYDHNLVWGDGDNGSEASGGLGGASGQKSGKGVGNMTANPNFINPSLDPKVANFELRPDSPARGLGAQFPCVPLIDLKGKPRPFAGRVTAGAYQ